MSYTALYRKWRPVSFEDVKGQDPIVQTLKNQITSERIGHAYLFCGTRGTGKTSIAKIFARAVNCEHPVDGSPCNECPTCKAIQSGSSMNVVEIDAASNNGVENIRDIRDQVQYPPTEGRYRVYIIDEVHMLSIGAFNALLKTLEEPPDGAVLILVADDINSILPTIRSRCQLVRCTPPTREQGIAYLKSQKVRNPEGELTRLSGRPLLIHEADPNLTLDKKDEAKYLEMLALGSALSSVQVLSAFQKDIPVGPVVSIMQRWYWDLMAVLSGAEPRYFPEHFEAYKRQVHGTDFQKLVPFNQTLMQANRSKDHPLSKRLVLQDLFITWAKTLADARKN